MNLGKIKRIHDLRLVWPHEANSFTKWLSKEENLTKLGEDIGIDLILEERESPVGNFSVDIFANEESTGRKVIIENQLEDTDHEHLGKLITYASGKNAEVVVWVVKRARDEHRQAIEWLNQHTDTNLGFFLVEIELWQIDICLTASAQKKLVSCGVYIPDNKELFHTFESKKEIFLREFGEEGDWKEASKATRILMYKPFDIYDEASWPLAFNWYIEYAIKCKKTFKKME